MSRDNEDRGAARYTERPATVATDVGDGPAVVFAHGTLMDRTMFDPQLDALAGDYRCVAYDLRARTDRYADEYDLDDLADDYAALLDGLGIESAVLVGMSMGGFTALRAAEHHPDRVEAIVLVDSDAGTHSEADREQYGALIEQMKETGHPTESAVEVAKHQLFGETTRTEHPGLVEAWARKWDTYPGLAIHNEIASWLHRDDFTDRAADLDCPALVTHGTEDVSIAMEKAEATADALGADLARIPEAGHSSNLENPEATNEALREFLASVY
ncbi:alpha/beta fold hydrolase [Halosegnis marinus]|uniref:Alpha/beta fold hydrolase n=1 Tax=Halosegnis marinus TaxID=3034023 RepID=A0ABD5ZKQ8_9EURY|nr:alpha/beta hydrolase [Halosegnis sp. DT85]